MQVKQLSFQSPSRSAMAAAAAWSRSRGVAGVRATTGLFSIFTLLCLVCLSSSLMHKDQLKDSKERLHKIEKVLDVVKAQMGAAKNLAALSVSLMESIDSDDSPLLQDFKDFEMRIKNLADIMDEEMRAQTDEMEKKLERERKSITFLEEQQFEL
ncbi:uncharacterized protein AB9X84_015044 isoform 2-T2 [Acanthopagrus schlegelii]